MNDIERDEIVTEDERQQADIRTRTFNGVVYPSISEMLIARGTFDTLETERIKSGERAIKCLLYSIIMYPLFLTIIGGIAAWIASIYNGCLALEMHTGRKVPVIIGFILDALPVIFLLIGIISYLFD